MTAQLAPTPIQKFFDNNGNPLFNGKLYSYVAGTSTPQATYTDSTMGTQNTNPVILNARGEANVWLDTTLSYKLVLQESNGTQIWSVDNIPGNGVFGTVQNIAALRNVTGVGVSNYQAIIVDGYTTAGDGGGGTFWWNSTSTVADNGGTIIAPTGIGTGRWYRLLDNPIEISWFGAIGDGTTDDTTALNLVQSLTGFPDIYLPTGTYSTTVASTSLIKNFHPPGQLITSSNTRAKYFSQISSAPSSFGNYNSIETAFNGDLSHSIFQIEHRITGAGTLGNPTTGYVYTPEAYPFFLYLYNTSGWNNGTSDNTGRTAAAAIRISIDQAGQGDCVAFNATGVVSGSKSGATSWLANPAASLFNGDLTAAQSGVYLNPYEIIIHDANYDVTGIGHVINLDRNNNTGLLGAIWFGMRIQNQGTKNPDAAISIPGGFNNGIDFTVSDFSGNSEYAAISMKAGQRIYFNNAANASGNIPANWVCTVFNGDYIEYNTGIGGINLVVGGGSTIQANSTQVTVLKPGGGGAVLDIDGATGQLHVNGTQVIQARATGYTASITGSDATTGWAASTATVAEVAGTVSALWNALLGHGLIGV